VKNDRYSAPIINNVSGTLLNHKRRLKLNRNLASLLSISLSQCLLLPYLKVPKIFTGIESYNIVREELIKLY
jgi:hypothetical protein